MFFMLHKLTSECMSSLVTWTLLKVNFDTGYSGLNLVINTKQFGLDLLGKVYVNIMIHKLRWHKIVATFSPWVTFYAFITYLNESTKIMDLNLRENLIQKINLFGGWVFTVKYITLLTWLHDVGLIMGSRRNSTVMHI